MTITTQLLTASLGAFGLSLILIPLIIYLAHRYEWYDERNHRKIHTEDIPRLGGVGIFGAFFVASLVAIVMAGIAGEIRPGASAAQILLDYLPIYVGLLIMHLMGLLDDFRNLRAIYKLLIQIVAATVVAVGSFSIHHLTIPFLWLDVQLEMFAIPLTVFWIVGVSNAVNFIDGIDGLAGGVAAIAALFYASVGLLLGDLVVTIVALGLFGSLLGFLAFNFPPARIFMGDSGSLTLGFMMAVFPLMIGGPAAGSSAASRSLHLLPGVTILALPLLDMGSAVIRRMRRGVPVFSPDREHIHHKLMDLGLRPWAILISVYSASLVLAAFAMSWYLLPVNVDMAILLAAWIACVITVGLLTRAQRRRISE